MSNHYVSVSRPEETQYLAQKLSEGGLDDETIGRALMHNVHDRGEADGLGVHVVRDHDGGRHGVVLSLPSGGHYEKLNDTGVHRIESFGVPEQARPAVDRRRHTVPTETEVVHR